MKAVVITLALAGLALAGCGRLGELEAPGPKETTKRTEEVVDPTVSKRTAPEAPIPGAPNPVGPPVSPQ
jgi:predicted small lipoprotein YifL